MLGTRLEDLQNHLLNGADMVAEKSGQVKEFWKRTSQSVPWKTMPQLALQVQHFGRCAEKSILRSTPLNRVAFKMV